MAYNLSQLTSGLSNISTDIYHYRNGSGIDKKIAMSDLRQAISSYNELSGSTTLLSSDNFINQKRTVKNVSGGRITITLGTGGKEITMYPDEIATFVWDGTSFSIDSSDFRARENAHYIGVSGAVGEIVSIPFGPSSTKQYANLESFGDYYITLDRTYGYMRILERKRNYMYDKIFLSTISGGSIARVAAFSTYSLIAICDTSSDSVKLFYFNGESLELKATLSSVTDPVICKLDSSHIAVHNTSSFAVNIYDISAETFSSTGNTFSGSVAITEMRYYKDNIFVGVETSTVRLFSWDGSDLTRSTFYGSVTGTVWSVAGYNGEIVVLDSDDKLYVFSTDDTTSITSEYTITTPAEGFPGSFFGGLCMENGNYYIYMDALKGFGLFYIDEFYTLTIPGLAYFNVGSISSSNSVIFEINATTKTFALVCGSSYNLVIIFQINTDGTITKLNQTSVTNTGWACRLSEGFFAVQGTTDLDVYSWDGTSLTLEASSGIPGISTIQSLNADGNGTVMYTDSSGYLHTYTYDCQSLTLIGSKSLYFGGAAATYHGVFLNESKSKLFAVKSGNVGGIYPFYINGSTNLLGLVDILVDTSGYASTFLPFGQPSQRNNIATLIKGGVAAVYSTIIDVERKYFVRLTGDNLVYDNSAPYGDNEFITLISGGYILTGRFVLEDYIRDYV